LYCSSDDGIIVVVEKVCLAEEHDFFGVL